jgi:hypothetical protein
VVEEAVSQETVNGLVSEIIDEPNNIDDYEEESDDDEYVQVQDEYVQPEYVQPEQEPSIDNSDEDFATPSAQEPFESVPQIQQPLVIKQTRPKQQTQLQIKNPVNYQPLTNTNCIPPCP